MNQTEYRQAADSVIYLAACVVNGILPDKQKVSEFDLQKLYKVANDHFMTAIVCHALESIGITDHQFIQAKFKSIRKISAMEIDKQQVFEKLEQAKIWYMPLKGSVIKDLYPSIGLRQMSDFDILFDERYPEKVKEIMEGLGFTCEKFAQSNHDIYYKQPVSNFEMHKTLFSELKTAMFDYYRDVHSRLIKDEQNDYGYHFSDDDMYVYITAHEYKHYTSQGSGIRSLMDCYVYLKSKNDKLDWSYIEKQTKLLGFDDYERSRRELALKVFSPDNNSPLTDAEKKMLSEHTMLGVYGTFENGIKNQLNGGSKASFWLRSIFIPYHVMTKSVPFTEKSILLYPLGFFWRCFRVLFTRRKTLYYTIKAVNKYGK